MTSKDDSNYGYILEIQVPDAMVFLHKLQETVWFSRTVIREGPWWSPLSDHHCSKDTVSPFSLLVVLYINSLCTLDYCTVSWIGWASILPHSLQTLQWWLNCCPAVTFLAGASLTGKEGGEMECMWSMALLVLMAACRPPWLSVHLSLSSRADFLKVITNGALIWEVTGPIKGMSWQCGGIVYPPLLLPLIAVWR